MEKMLDFNEDGCAKCETEGFSDLFRTKFFEMYINGKFCDITLHVGDHSIEAHQLVLCAASDFFRGMFASNLNEVKDHRASFSTFEPAAFKSVIEYCYTGSLVIRDETVEDILTISHGLLMEPVTDFCCDYLIHSLDPQNCIGIQAIADTHDCQRLNEAATKYVLKNFSKVIHHSEFTKLSKDQVTAFISSNYLTVTAEEVVLAAVGWWLVHDYQNRKQYAYELLSLVRLPHVSKKFLFCNILEHGLFNEDFRCLKMAINALKYQDFPELRYRLKSSQSKPRFSALGLLYVVSTHMGYSFDPGEQKWTRIPDLRRCVSGSAVAFYLGMFYCCGGEEGLKSSPMVRMWLHGSQNWVNESAMRNSRREFDSCVLDGSLYVCGGIGAVGVTKQCERQSGSWKHIAAMNNARAQHSVAAFNDKVYAVGGESEGVIGGFKYKASGEMYDPKTNSWESIACMNIARANFGLVAADGFLYAVGGTVGCDSGMYPPPTSSVERFDPKTGRWDIVGSLIIPCHSSGVVFWDEKIYCIGGVTTDCVPLQIVQIYDIATDTWSEGEPVPDPVLDPAAFVCPLGFLPQESEEEFDLMIPEPSLEQQFSEHHIS